MDQPIVRKAGKKDFLWDKKAFGGKGAWYEVHKKGGFGRLASRKEKEVLGNPNTPIENKEAEKPQDKTQTEGGMSRNKGRAIRNTGLKDLFRENLLEGHGFGAITKTLSESFEAKMMGFQEAFDPLSIARRFTGPLGATILGLATGRSDNDLEYFTGRRRTKSKIKAVSNPATTGKKVGALDTATYTSVSENQQRRFRKGDGTGDLMARLLNLMKKYHEEDIKQHELDRDEEKARKKERTEWNKEVIKSAGGKTATPVGVGGAGGEGDSSSVVGDIIEGVAAYQGGKFALKRMLKTKIGRNLVKSVLRANRSVGKGIGKLGKFLTGSAGEKVATEVASKSATTVTKIAEKPGFLMTAEEKIAQRAAAKGLGKVAGKEAAESVGKAASKVADKTLIKKAVTKALGAAGKSIVKKIPLIGLGAGLWFAADRAMAGDFKGAAAEATSGALGTIPGVGTAGSVAIDVALMARDIYKETYGVFPEDDDPRASSARLQDISDSIKEITGTETATKVESTPIAPPKTASATTTPSPTPTAGSTSPASSAGAGRGFVSPPTVGSMTATPAGSSPSAVSSRVQAAIAENQNEKTTTGSLKPIVVDNSKSINRTAKSDDTVSYGDNFNVREVDPTLRWIIETNIRRV